jgi:hypothetical protein
LHKRSLYQESRTPIYWRMVFLSFFGLFFFIIIMAAGIMALVESTWLLGICTLLGVAAMVPIGIGMLWRLWRAPVLLLTGVVRQKRLVSAHHPIGMTHHRITVRPSHAVQISSDGKELPASLDNLTVDYVVQSGDFSRVQEGDQIQLLCIPRLKQGVRLVAHWEAEQADASQATPQSVTGQPVVEALPGQSISSADTVASQPAPVQPRATNSLSHPDPYQAYRNYLQQRLLLTLVLGLGLSGFACSLSLFGLVPSEDGDLSARLGGAFCLFSLGMIGLFVTGVYLWPIWQAQPMRLTAVVLGRRENQRRSRGVVVFRSYYLRLRPLRIVPFTPKLNGSQITSSSEHALSHSASEVEYNVPHGLFEQVKDNEQIECLVVPSLKRIIARIDDESQAGQV